MVSMREPAAARSSGAGARPGSPDPDLILEPVVIEMMDRASPDRMPMDVLIVEDDPIIALDFEDTILGFGVTQVRTAGSVAQALDLIGGRVPDFALLDVGLVREKSFAIAERLRALQIPFVFVTGYGAEVRLPATFADRPRLPKPCSREALQAALRCNSGDGARR